MPSIDDYLETRVLTASPHRLHLLVVEGALRFMRQGLTALEESRWEDMDQAFRRARDCVAELIGGIQPESAPELAATARGLFLSIYRWLALAELQRNPRQIEAALRLLETHRETWVELGVKLAGAPPAALAAVPGPHALRAAWTA
jgi:flagellar protein FliS